MEMHLFYKSTKTFNNQCFLPNNNQGLPLVLLEAAQCKHSVPLVTRGAGHQVNFLMKRSLV
jgi:hypothetical protein